MDEVKGEMQRERSKILHKWNHKMCVRAFNPFTAAGI